MKIALVVLVAAAALWGCGSSECKFITRCNGNNTEMCLHGDVSPDETCASPNVCTQLTDDFAGCVVGGRTTCTGGFGGDCVSNSRTACRSDSRKAGISWGIASTSASFSTGAFFSAPSVPAMQVSTFTVEYWVRLTALGQKNQLRVLTEKGSAQYQFRSYVEGGNNDHFGMFENFSAGGFAGAN